jgi:hypothetical protein
MRLLTPDRNLRRAVAAAAIAGHARLVATHFDQLALALAFDVGHAILRGVNRAAGDGESQHAPL